MSSTVNVDYPKQDTRLPIELLSAFFLLLGASILFVLAFVINDDLSTTSALTSEQRLLNFLKNIGIIRPILAITASVMLIRLGLRFRTGFTGAARWGRMILLWLMVIIGLGILQAINRSLNLEASNLQATGADFILNIGPWGLALVLFGSVFVFLNRNMHLFKGDENIIAQRTRTAWSLLAPTLIIFFLIGIGPLEQVFVTSMTNERFASSEQVEFVGFNNYARLLGVRLDTLPCTEDATGGCLTETRADGQTVIVYPGSRRYLSDNVTNYREREYRPMSEFTLMGTRYIFSARDREFIDALTTSIIYSVFGIGLQLIIGMGIAMILTARLRGMSLLRVALLVPLAIPTLIATQFWDVMLLPNASGVANSFLLNIGLIDTPQRWLLDANLQLPALILVIVWKETPSMALLLLPGLLSISPEVYQAASVDGASKWQQFWRITLPMMRPTIGVALVLRTMVMLRVFDVFEILVGQRRFSLATYAHDVLLQRQELGYSSTISVAIFIIILIFTIIYMRSLRIDQT